MLILVIWDRNYLLFFDFCSLGQVQVICRVVVVSRSNIGQRRALLRDLKFQSSQSGTLKTESGGLNDMRKKTSTSVS